MTKLSDLPDYKPDQEEDGPGEELSELDLEGRWKAANLKKDGEGDFDKRYVIVPVSSAMSFKYPENGK